MRPKKKRLKGLSKNMLLITSIILFSCSKSITQEQKIFKDTKLSIATISEPNNEGFITVDLKFRGPLSLSYNCDYGLSFHTINDSHKRNLYSGKISLLDFNLLNESCYVLQDEKSLKYSFLNRINTNYGVINEGYLRTAACPDTIVNLSSPSEEFSTMIHFHQSDFTPFENVPENVRLVYVDKSSKSLYFSAWVKLNLNRLNIHN